MTLNAYVACHSTVPRLSDAWKELGAAVRAGLGGAPPDLSFVFVSHEHTDGCETLARQVCDATGSRVLLGCTGEAVVGGDEELEQGPAVSLWSARLPETQIEPFRAEFARTPDGFLCSGLPSASEAGDDAPRAALVLGEPYSSLPNSILEHFALEFPGLPVLGGMASGAAQPGENRLFIGSDCVEYGAVGALLRGGPTVRSIVSQGCRPIGTHYVVTRADENLIQELGGVPPLKRLQEFLPDLPLRDQRLAARGLLMGLVMNEYQEKFGRGDFLITSIIGADRNTGAIALGNLVRVGQTVQFHVRDAETADEDLVQLLEQDRAGHAAPPRGALLFSCNGRGTRLFPAPHHDAAAIQRTIGPLPLAGFFAQGELGPVGGKNHIHGYTASVAIFE